MGNKYRLGKPSWSKGKKLNVEYRQKLSEAQKKAWKEGKYTAERNKKVGHKGAEHHNWKGGITPLRVRLYHTKEYQEWRSAVFQRDNWTCQTCGLRGYKLEAHHIKSWAKYPELRFNFDNGVALCKDCHRLITKLNGRIKK